MLYSSPKKIPDGRYYLKVTTDEGNRLMLQLNDTTLVTKFSEGDNVTLSLSDTAQEKVDAVNSENLAQAETNSKEWFGKTVSGKTLQAAHTTNINENVMNVGKATVNKNVVTKCYNHRKELVDLDTLDENTVCDVMVELSGLWFAKKTFGPIWRIAQIRLKAPPRKKYPDEYLFADEDDNEGEESSEENDEDYI